MELAEQFLLTMEPMAAWAELLAEADKREDDFETEIPEVPTLKMMQYKRRNMRRGPTAPRGTRPGQLCIDTVSDLRNAFTKYQIFSKDEWNSKKENERVILDVFELKELLHIPWPRLILSIVGW